MILNRLLEPFARALVYWRRHRLDAACHRRDQRLAEAEARKVAFESYEVAHAEERLRLARELFAWAPTWTATSEGRWAFAHFCRWPLAAGLSVDQEARFWRSGERHWFGNVPDKIISDLATLANTFTTNVLRAALRATRQSFWLRVLDVELGNAFLDLVGMGGRPV